MTMTYSNGNISRLVLPAVRTMTLLVLISFLLISNTKLVRARPQDNSIEAGASQANNKDEGGYPSIDEIRVFVTERPESIIAYDAEKDRNHMSVAYNNPLKSELIKPVTGTPTRFYAEYSVNSGLDLGRSAIQSTKTDPSVNTVRPINKQLMPANASDMVSTDVRTPPKIKSQIEHSHHHHHLLQTPGKGEAIPVLLDGNEEAALQKISSDNFKYTHSDSTPSAGLSTWVLLNADSVPTPFFHKKTHKPVLYDVSDLTTIENTTTDHRKKTKSTPSPSAVTVENIKSKIDAVVMKKTDRKPIATVQKVNQTHTKKPPTTTTILNIDETSQTTTAGITLQDFKFKNKTPVVVGKVPSTTKLQLNTTTPMTFVQSPGYDNLTRLGTPVVTFPHVPLRTRPNSMSSTTRKPFVSSTRSNIPARISSIPVEFTTEPTPFTVATFETSSVIGEENTELSPSTETTVKKSASTISSKKKKKRKKKKNKNKRRTVVQKKPGKVQSKISDDDNSTSKLPSGNVGPNRPLSTRIYNYLAREVMPNVGVGIVGLMLTAGLAGLLLYPFGAAVPIRRNYEKPQAGYNLNDYSPVGEVDNAQPEESVLSQLLAGMSNTMNQYSREQPDLVYKNPPRYKPARFDNPSYLSHHKEVKFTTENTLGDEVKYSDFGDVVSGPHDSVKFTSFDINDSIKYPMDGSEPHSPNYSTSDKISNVQNEQTAYHSKPPSPNYSTLDITSNTENEPTPYHSKYGPESQNNMKQDTYSTLGEYSSFNNPNELVQSPVYNGEGYEYKNHKDDTNMQEFKVSSELEVATQMAENQTGIPSTSAKPVTKHEQPSFAALEGIPKNYRTLQTSIRFEEAASVLPMNQDFVPSDGGMFATSVEHGPRSMKLRRRRKRNVSSENEIDSDLLEANETDSSSTAPVRFITTTLAQLEKNVTASASNSSEIMSNEIFEEVKLETSTEAKGTVTSSTRVESSSASTTTEIIKDGVHGIISNLEQKPSSVIQNFSLSKLFQKILDFKLRLGMELIRATSEVIGRYLSNVQARMSEALRNIRRSAFRTTADDRNNNNIIKRRDTRAIKYFLGN